MTVTLEQVTGPPPEDKTRVGPRCLIEHVDVGRCNRHRDHLAEGDPWHYAVTGFDDVTRTADHWRWRTDT